MKLTWELTAIRDVGPYTVLSVFFSLSQEDTEQLCECIPCTQKMKEEEEAAKKAGAERAAAGKASATPGRTPSSRALSEETPPRTASHNPRTHGRPSEVARMLSRCCKDLAIVRVAFE